MFCFVLKDYFFLFSFIWAKNNKSKQEKIKHKLVFCYLRAFDCWSHCNSPHLSKWPSRTLRIWRLCTDRRSHATQDPEMLFSYLLIRKKYIDKFKFKPNKTKIEYDKPSKVDNLVWEHSLSKSYLDWRNPGKNSRLCHLLDAIQ